MALRICFLTHLVYYVSKHTLVTTFLYIKFNRYLFNKGTSTLSNRGSGRNEIHYTPPPPTTTTFYVYFLTRWTRTFKQLKMIQKCKFKNDLTKKNYAVFWAWDLALDWDKKTIIIKKPDFKADIITTHSAGKIASILPTVIFIGHSPTQHKKGGFKPRGGNATPFPALATWAS